MRALIHTFLDENIGVGADCNFNDYDSKGAILDYAIELIGEEDRLTQGCGVGPLMGHIQEWVDQFEQEASTQKTNKYDQKLINQLEQKGFSSTDLNGLITHLYSKEGQQGFLSQAYTQICDGVSSIDKIKFKLGSSDETIMKTIKELDKKTLSFLKKYINEEFKIILNDRLDHLFKAVSNLHDLKDVNSSKRFKM